MHRQLNVCLLKSIIRNSQRLLENKFCLILYCRCVSFNASKEHLSINENGVVLNSNCSNCNKYFTHSNLKIESMWINVDKITITALLTEFMKQPDLMPAI